MANRVDANEPSEEVEYIKMSDKRQPPAATKLTILQIEEKIKKHQL